MPAVSVMLPTFNPVESYFAEMIRSVLVGAASDTHIEVVDDASTSVDVARLIVDIDKDGRIGFHRRSQNGGLGACWNDCLARARGELVHILHQDDRVAPDFYRRMRDCLAANPEAGMAVCRHAFIDENGNRQRLSETEQNVEGVIPDWSGRISRKQRVQCPAVVVRSSVYKAVGGFRHDLKFFIDWEMWVRIARRCPVAYVPDVLAEYRVHTASETQRLIDGGEVAADLERCIRQIASDDSGSDPSAARNACLFAADYAGARAATAAQEGQLGPAAAWVAAAIRFLRVGGVRQDRFKLRRWWLKLHVGRLLQRSAGRHG